MAQWQSALVAMLVGAVVGMLIWRHLREHGYRRADERQLPARRNLWIVPATALTSGMTWLSIPAGAPLMVPCVYLLCSWVMVVLAAIDLDVHRLPNAIQLPAYPLLLLLLSACSLAVGDWTRLLRAVAAGLALFAFYLFLAAITPDGAVGLGDVKLAGLLGTLLGWLGWGHVVLATIATFLLGGFIAVVLLATRRARLGSTFAYGPSMFLGAIIAIASPLVIRVIS